MINLSDRNAAGTDTGNTTAINVDSGGSNAATTGAGLDKAGISTPVMPAGKPAPRTLGGINIPPGSTVVEDPDLLREILDATKGR